MKNLIITLLLCVIICASLNSFGQELKRETRRITENFEGPFLTFFEDFNWKMENGEFDFKGGDSSKYYMKNFTDDFYDFTLSAKSIWKSGNKNNGYGIFFRENEGQLYAFDITQTGYYRLQWLKDGAWNLLVEWTKTSLIKSPTNNLKVTCKGNSIKCYLNNIKVVDIADNSILHGDVGFGVGGNVKCSFDDFKIAPPEDGKEENNSDIITENFNGSSSIFTYDENWELKSGELHFSSKNSKFGIAYLHDEFSDFTVKSKVKWTGKEEGAVYGIDFRECDEGGYSFLISQNGQYTLLKVVGSSASKLQPVTQSLYISSGYNELKITCKGSRIDCFINNKKVVSVTDNSYPKGFVSYFADPNVECAFDDFSIGPPVEDKESAPEEIFSEVVNENFDEGKTEFGLDNGWSLEDGELYYSTDDESCMGRNRLNKSFTDCIVSVKTKWDGKAKNSAFGLRFGTDYAFFIAQDGHYKLSKLNGSKWSDIIGWQKTDLISDDYNNLKVNCSGKNIIAYLNNTMVINIQENSYAGGNVGLACSCNVEAYFDDFIVSIPNKNITGNKNYNTVSKNAADANVIVRENFDGSQTSFRMDEYWKMKNGMLVCANGDKSFLHMINIEGEYKDCSIMVKARWDGRAKNTGFGFQFGYKSSNEYYIFRIAPDGRYQLLSRESAHWNNIISWTKTTLIKDGFNDLKITCSGKNISAYINNELVVNTKIDAFSGGKIGLVCSGDLDASFDDFVILKNGE